MTLEQITRDAVQLPKDQRLTLAKILLEMDDSAGDSGVEAAWDKEIHERVRAVEEGKAEGIPYEQARARIDDRLGR